jgi:hypothetical protein
MLLDKGTGTRNRQVSGELRSDVRLSIRVLGCVCHAVMWGFKLLIYIDGLGPCLGTQATTRDCVVIAASLLWPRGLYPYLGSLACIYKATSSRRDRMFS